MFVILTNGCCDLTVILFRYNMDVGTSTILEKNGKVAQGTQK